MKRLLACAALLLGTGDLIGQTNTTSALAADYLWGQKATSAVNGTTLTQFWFSLKATQGRSYCVEAGNFEGTFGDKAADTELTVFGPNDTTVIAANDDAFEEPSGLLHSRACWVQPATERIYVKLLPHSSTVPSTLVTLRFLESTLYCNWFFIAGDYNAFSLIRNTSDTALSGVVVTWRNLNGAVAGTTTVAISGNGGVILNARDFVNPAVVSNGTVEIAYAGSPEQLQGSTTTLSGTTGLGFDALFVQRKVW